MSVIVVIGANAVLRRQLLCDDTAQLQATGLRQGERSLSSRKRTRKGWGAGDSPQTPTNASKLVAPFGREGS